MIQFWDEASSGVILIKGYHVLFLMQEQQLRMRDIERDLEEMTRYLSENNDTELEQCAMEWRDAYRRSFILNGNRRNHVISKKLYGAYLRYVDAYKTRDRRHRTPRRVEVIPLQPLPLPTPQYRSWIESLGGPYRLRAVSILTF